jgi:hypothetical protein
MHGSAERPHSCPWWADDEEYMLGYVCGHIPDLSDHLSQFDELDDQWERALKIEASPDPDDYEIDESPHWPPPRPPKLTPEEEERLHERMGLVAELNVWPCWVFHKNDADPWPSRLHGHHNARPLKLDAINGFIYSIHTRKHVQTLRPKALLPIQR